MVHKFITNNFQLDIVIENNKYAIDALEQVKRKMSRMSTLEQEKFKLDEKLGGSSGILMTKAIRRIYGEHAYKIIEALKKNPLVTVPKVSWHILGLVSWRTFLGIFA